jgi:subtilisin family serine protease
VLTTRWLTAALVAASVVLVPPAPTAASAAEVGTAAAPAVPTQVTLVTGDVVAYVDRSSGPDSVQVVGRRPGIRYDVFDRADGWHVLPSDAEEAVISGRVDDALFNVTYLVRNGYRDSDRRDVPVILDFPEAAPGTRAADRAAVADALPASTVTRSLPSIDGVAVDVDKSGANQLWQAEPGLGDVRLLLDRRVHVDLAESVAQISAPRAWAAGFDGTGVRVGVLDTGIDLTHPDLAGKVVDSASFVAHEPDVVDHHGHGTHVASTIVGSGAASGGVEKGVAPGARLVVGKVLDRSGYGDTSEIIAGMEWAAGRAKVVSMSLGGDRPAGVDPMADAVNRLTAATGTLFVIAAGNSGPGMDTVGTPGIATSALTVGADDRDREIASFASRGPGIDGAIKPEVVAPGVNIVAARAAGTTLGTPVNDRYTTASGTSMATPHVAGAAAVLAERHPDWTNEQLKGMLVGSTTDLGLPVNDQGAGQVDVAAAVGQTVTASPATIGFGELAPGAGDQTATLTYRNAGTSDVTLDLRARLADAAGQPAPDGTLEVPWSVTVPAGGTAQVPVVLHPGKTGIGPRQGLVTAAADGVAVHTPVGFTNGAVSHTVHVQVTGFDGKPLNEAAYLWVLPVDRPADGASSYVVYGSASLRLPVGKYFMSLMYFTDHGPELLEATGVVYKPEVAVEADLDLSFDYSKTKRATVRTQEAGTESAVVATGVRTTADGRPWTFNTAVGSWSANLFVAGGEPVTTGAFDFQYTTTVTRSQLGVRVGGVTVHPEYLAAYGGGHDNVAPKKIRMFDGRRGYDLVYVGAGEPADFAAAGDLRGKVVLAQVHDVYTGAGTRFAERAVQAGAAGVLMFDSTRATMRGDADQNEVVPVGYLAHPDGVRLVAALRNGRARTEVVGRPTSPYAYHLAYVSKGRVPATPAYTVRTRDLARFDTTYHAKAETMYATGFSRNEAPEPPLVESIRAPQTRAEYYGPVTDGASWVRYTGTFVGDQWELLSGRATPLRAGTRTSDEWYGTPMRYGQSEFFNLPTMPAPYLANRQGNSIYVFPLLRDGAGHVSAMAPNTALLSQSLSRDGRPVTAAPGSPVTRYDVPADRGDYRLDLAYTPGGDYRVDTSWTFTSAPGGGKAAPGFQCWNEGGPIDTTCQPLPTISVDYDVVASAGTVEIRFRPHHVGDITSKITQTRLSVSPDGRTWVRVRTTPSGHGWQVGRVRALVSLRVEARDQAGNTVTETVTNA